MDNYGLVACALLHTRHLVDQINNSGATLRHSTFRPRHEMEVVNDPRLTTLFLCREQKVHLGDNLFMIKPGYVIEYMYIAEDDFEERMKNASLLTTVCQRGRGSTAHATKICLFETYYKHTFGEIHNLVCLYFPHHFSHIVFATQHM